MVEVKVPTVGESISEVQIGRWLKQQDEWVEADEDLVEIETEKASVQIPSPSAGYLRNITKQQDEFAKVGDVIAQIEAGEAPSANGTASTAAAAPAGESADDARVMPAAARLIAEHNLNPADIKATGPGGRLLKEDVVDHISGATISKVPAAAPKQPAAAPAKASEERPRTSLMTSGEHRAEEVKPLSMLRRTIAARLVEAQHNAALLTTFNEIDMEPVKELRSKYKDAFQKKHGVKLGFMSFFAKAAVEALRRFPAVNSEIRGNNIVYRHYYDIGIAIGGGKGLVVPILRNVEFMSFADVERAISDFADDAQANRLNPQDLDGGTFTISNGGIYGSLLSTPIVNPPQSGILGLHSIQDRPMAINGEVVIRPMMYVALTYDHRVVDGREAVSFLRVIKDVLEDPARLFLEV
ncbi:Dihydrolipoyllysine-residue succinyltransferase component of 2-oxoglutarate dehydrogenase complex [Rosistilla carotiformis]|uniref:Dihydrolipoyllysine-residue succinyltransferase component of 2-oxoglutarate dehydrogenase complex n=1 Tax=Rosistilla carotiformis TaxID=2528017 RepID=A0A518JUF6_9BACT|nr:2-oxoglutarate dehydrogenase complex dihydrolipoyllysine-residue succinyltransferase [Rosistilla carotiformis]QDV69184.1 Dihydrolipoyllysine-residue succinyltransferase component of 2-oxoglutarate dehydrogenase complex [Rosistilla carotiformis]